MLQIKQLCKEYRTGNLVQKALDHVDLNLRDNEFVAILGPSGSGKTTLLNIIGGLDRYDSGNLIINGISTDKYKDRDWDSYRNHTVGFVFQSYNLIPHQTILSNVELALTISGVDKNERRQRAIHALTTVGLGEQIHKKPSQLSGGQMQRVAIARALVNNPNILLADEPTGALDSNTSVQVMDLLKEVAKDRLVVMVTHNPDLAKQYATRIVNLRDGKIRSDSNPFILEQKKEGEAQHQNMGRSSMSFLTALSLSFHNLWTKKARTLLTAFAGSIGIIGIALILALSSGVNAYIKSVETDTLSQYPLQIQSTGFDFSSMMLSMANPDNEEKKEGEVDVIEMVSDMFSTMDSNDLKSLKAYIDSGESNLEQYTSAIEYSYNVSPQIYREEEKDGKKKIRQVHPDKSFEAMGFGSSMTSNSMMSSMMGTDVFYEMPENAGLYESQYEVKAGRWPQNYNECVVVLTSNGSISDFMLYTLGLRDAVELDDMIKQFMDEETVDTPEEMGSYTYEDILGVTFKRINRFDCYQYDADYNVWKDKSDNKKYMKKLVADGEDIRVVGIVQPAEDAKGQLLQSGIAYPPSLTKHVIDEAAGSDIVKEQLSHKKKNVFTGKKFGKSGKKDDLKMDSLFTVDEDAFQDIFQFDADSLFGDADSFDFSDMFKSDGDSIDFSKMLDPDQMNFHLPDMKDIDIRELLDGVDMNISTGEMDALTSRLLEGYIEYLSSYPEADYINLEQYFLDYLRTGSAKEILNTNVQQMLEENGVFVVSNENIRDLFREVLEGYQPYAKKNGYTDPDKFDDYLMEYLQTEEGTAILNRWGNDIIKNNGVAFSDVQLKKMASDLVSGYGSYASENGAPDPSEFGKFFEEYLRSDAAKQNLRSGIADLIPSDQLQKNLTKAIKKGTKELTDTYSDEIQALMNAVMTQIVNQIGSNIGKVMEQAMAQIGSNMGDMLDIDGDAFADAFSMNMDMDEFSELLTSMNSAQNASYENNLRTLGYADFDEPGSIDIYPIDFESKEQVVAILDDYNARMEAEGKEEQVITYTDMVGTLMSSVTDIVDIISYVLIAFVAISLVVSSIMIGVITYISVLERKKEIGILRAIGASKRNISQVFNAETFIIGLCAGLIGIGLTFLILIPGNALIHQLAGSNNVNAVLAPVPALVLVLLSIGLTLLGGLIPSKKAAKSDPVAALRTE